MRVQQDFFTDDKATNHFESAADDYASTPVIRITAVADASLLLLDSNKKRAKTLHEKAVDLLPTVNHRVLLRNVGQGLRGHRE